MLPGALRSSTKLLGIPILKFSSIEKVWPLRIKSWASNIELFVQKKKNTVSGFHSKYLSG